MFVGVAVHDPFGKVVNRQGSTPNPFTYSGRFGVMDDDNGLYYMRQRYYAPNLMRFVHKDPTFRGTLGEPQSLNRYTYAGGNPIQWIDPEGDMPTWVAGALIGVGIQAGIDIYQGEFSGWGAYAGAALEGAITGAFGPNYVMAGAIVGAAAGNILKQRIERTSDPYQLQQAVLLGAIGGGVGKAFGKGFQKTKAFEKVGNRAARRAGQGFIGRAMDRAAKRKYMKIVLKKGGSEKLGKLYQRARNATGGPVIPVDVAWIGQLTTNTLRGLVTGVGKTLAKSPVNEPEEMQALESFLNDF